MMNFVFQMMNFVFQMMDLGFKMMDLRFKMMNGTDTTEVSGGVADGSWQVADSTHRAESHVCGAHILGVCHALRGRVRMEGVALVLPSACVQVDHALRVLVCEAAALASRPGIGFIRVEFQAHRRAVARGGRAAVAAVALVVEAGAAGRVEAAVAVRPAGALGAASAAQQHDQGQHLQRVPALACRWLAGRRLQCLGRTAVQG